MWNTNIYPGVKCDVPADVYQSMFLPSLDWTTPYAAGAEIKAYWESIVRKYDVRSTSPSIASSRKPNGGKHAGNGSST